MIAKDNPSSTIHFRKSHSILGGGDELPIKGNYGVVQKLRILPRTTRTTTRFAAKIRVVRVGSGQNMNYDVIDVDKIVNEVSVAVAQRNYRKVTKKESMEVRII